MKILVVEDQSALRDSIVEGLCCEEFAITGVSTCKAAKNSILSDPPALVILDLTLPDGNGINLLTEVRQRGFQNRVLILSAQDSLDQRVFGLNSGADDYIVKPFQFAELRARVHALLRRGPIGTQTILECGDLQLDLVKRTARRSGNLIELTARQFDVLAFLVDRQNSVVTREMLAAEVWRDKSSTWTNVIEVQINRLRKKIDGQSPFPLLHTVRGRGYMIGEFGK